MHLSRPVYRGSFNWVLLSGNFNRLLELDYFGRLLRMGCAGASLDGILEGLLIINVLSIGLFHRVLVIVFL